MLRCLALVLVAPLTSALHPRDYRVPPVDFTQLSSAPDNAHNIDLLAKLQQDGIIALQHVPNYASLRSEYLRTAAYCAVRAQKTGAEFLLHRQLRDGTNRYTVSLKSGRELSEVLDQSAELLALCPEYVEVHAAFSEAVELAVANVGTALDTTQKFHVAAEQGEVVMTARKLLEESVHLDHFHVYEAARTLLRLQDDAEINVADMSLELHTDNGLMIAMSAPEYFEVLGSGEVKHKDTEARDAGLFIQTASGEVVRPVLMPDELVLMLGSGIDDWVKTSPPLHSVLHGMQYPRAVSMVDGHEKDSKLLRSWFGKMILLDTHQVMDNTGLTFGQYANQTTRYLGEQEAEDSKAFGAVACPPHRRLAASDNSCSLKTCSLKSTASASDLTYSCQITCNHDSTVDAASCEKYCDCVDSTSSGTTCWMLCVENFPADVCPGEQECNNASSEDQLAMTCVDETVAPSISTGSTASSAGSSIGNIGSSDADSSATTTASTTAASSPGTSTESPATTAPTAPASTTVSPPTGSNSVSFADSVAASNVGDESTAASTTSESSSPSTAASIGDEVSSSSASASSAASVIPVAVFLNAVAVLVAAFLCIQ